MDLKNHNKTTFYKFHTHLQISCCHPTCLLGFSLLGLHHIGFVFSRARGWSRQDGSRCPFFIFSEATSQLFSLGVSLAWVLDFSITSLGSLFCPETMAAFALSSNLGTDPCSTVAGVSFGTKLCEGPGGQLENSGGLGPEFSKQIPCFPGNGCLSASSRPAGWVSGVFGFCYFTPTKGFSSSVYLHWCYFAYCLPQNFLQRCHSAINWLTMGLLVWHPYWLGSLDSDHRTSDFHWVHQRKVHWKASHHQRSGFWRHCFPAWPAHGGTWCFAAC